MVCFRIDDSAVATRRNQINHCLEPIPPGWSIKIYKYITYNYITDINNHINYINDQGYVFMTL